MNKKSIIAQMIVEAAEIVELDNEVARIVRATGIIIDADKVRVGLIYDIRKYIDNLELSGSKMVRKHNYHRLSKVLAKEYMALD